MEEYILVKRKIGNIFNGFGLGKTFSLNEGLIKTEPIEKLVKHAKEYCNFASSADEYNRGNYQGVIRVVDGSNGTKAIKTIFRKSEYNEKLIDTMFNTYGYFKSNVENLDNNYIAIEYEAKFEEILNKQLESKGYIYHLTTEKKLNNILRNGIKTHKGNNTFNYPHRSYFFTNLMTDEFFKMFYNEKIEYNNNIECGKFYKVSLVLLKIDLKGLLGKTKFYVDPNMDNGVYTEDYIPPQNITVQKKINYKILKKGNGDVIERK